MFKKRICCIAKLSYDERLNYLGLERLEARRLFLDLLFLYKFKFHYSHVTIENLNIFLSRLHNYWFSSLLSLKFNHIDYYFHTVRTVRLWNSLNSNITSAFNLCLFRRLLSRINFVPYLRGRS